MRIRPSRSPLALSLAGVFLLAAQPRAVLAQPPSFTINTIAGTSVPDGSPGPETQLYGVGAVAADSNGNVYVVELQGARVRKVAPDGTTTIFAGTGVSGYPVAGQPATQTMLSKPEGVAVDAQGNVYISDSGALKIFKVGSDGILNNFAGSGGFGNEGDGGPAFNATLRFNGQLAVGPDGSVYVSIRIDSLVRRITPDGNIETVAGSGSQGFSGDGGPAKQAQLYDPAGLAVDAEGNLYIAEPANNRIRMVDPSGMIQTVAGGGTTYTDEGPALQVLLHGPSGVAWDGAGLYISNSYLNTLDRLEDGNITQIAGIPGQPGFNGDTKPAAAAQFNQPGALAMGVSGDLLVVDAGNSRIRKIAASTIVSTIAGTGNSTGDGGPAVDAHIYTPAGLAVGDSGQIIITGGDDARIRAVSYDGIIGPFAGTGISGTPQEGGVASEQRISFISAADLDAQGNVYFPDLNARTIYRVGHDGKITRFLENLRADRIAIDRDHGVMYPVSRYGTYQIFRVDLATKNVAPYAGTGVNGFSGDGGPAIDAELGAIYDIALDRSGNLYLLDFTNRRVRKVDVETGIIHTIAGNGDYGAGGDGGPALEAQFGSVTGIAAAADGTVYVSDAANHSVRMISTDGMVYRVVGTGQGGFGGDGGPSTQATLNGPTGVAIDPQGNLYISDTNNQRVRKLTIGLPQVSVVNSAGITVGIPRNQLSAGAIASVYGEGLASGLVAGNGSDLELGDTSVVVTDSQGATRDAGLYFVAARQLNIVIPEGTAQGDAVLTVRRNGVPMAAGSIKIAQVAPALFTADATGTGLAAAGVLTVASDGTQLYDTVAAAVGGGVPTHIDLTKGKVYIILYGTGIRNAGDLEVTAKVQGQDVPVLGYAAQSQYPGLDQANIGPIPDSLIGYGMTTIRLFVGGIEANTVTMYIQ